MQTRAPWLDEFLSLNRSDLVLRLFVPGWRRRMSERTVTITASENKRGLRRFIVVEVSTTCGSGWAA